MPALAQTSWNTNPQVPEPSGLYRYIRALDSWVKGAPFEDPMIGGLIQVCQFGDSARRDFSSGRQSLWALVPPIDALQIEEAKLDLVGLRALTVPVTLRGRHALHHFLPEQPSGIPESLVDLEYICGLLLRSLDNSGEISGSASERRISILLQELEGRSNPSVELESSRDHLEIPKRAPRESKEAPAPEKPKVEISEEDLSPEELIQRRVRSAARHAGARRLAVAVLLIPLLASLSWILPSPGGGLPSVSNYQEVPLVAMVRYRGAVRVRVHASWFTVPEQDRSVAVKALWDRLVEEYEDEGLELTVADNVNQTRGGVVAGQVWWISPTRPDPDEPSVRP